MSTVIPSPPSASPIQSVIRGLSGYSSVRTAYMLKNVANPTITNAIRQRNETPARIAPIA